MMVWLVVGGMVWLGSPLGWNLGKSSPVVSLVPQDHIACSTSLWSKSGRYYCFTKLLGCAYLIVNMSLYMLQIYTYISLYSYI